MIIYILVPLHKQTSHEPSSRKTRGKILEIKKKKKLLKPTTRCMNSRLICIIKIINNDITC